MKLSFVLPTYNMEKYLARCLDSLLAQDISPSSYEILVVNDGSRDNTLSIAKTYEKNFQNIRVIDKPNGGVGSARNTGLKAARGTYVYFFDPDDYIARNVLGKLMMITDEKDPELLGFQFTNLDAKDDLKLEVNTNIKTEALEVKSGLEFINQQNYTNEAWWYLVKKSFLIQNGIVFMEDRLMEDVIFTYETLLHVKKMIFIPLDVYRYIIVPNSIRTSKEPKHFRKFVFDCEKAVYTEGDLIENHVDENTYPTAYKRLKAKQQAVVFFLILRLIRSDIPFSYVGPMLNGFREIEAYPFTYFPGKDFKAPVYTLISIIMNTKWLLYPFMYILRAFFKLLGLFK